MKKLKNNWYVITGGPSAGKTTCLEMIKNRGFRIVHEAARVYIDQEMSNGKTIEQIREDEFLFQKKVLELKIEIEKKLPGDEIIFFDRGIPDSEAYYKLCGEKNDNLLNEAMAKCGYKEVFLLDILDFEKDYARTESVDQQREIHDLLEESYKKLPIPLINVPKMNSKEERVEFILGNL